MRWRTWANQEHLSFLAEKDWNANWAIGEMLDGDWAYDGSVYFVESGDGTTKIGFTRGDPADRVSSLQVGNPHPLRLAAWTPGCRRKERALHDMFYVYRFNGEWFRSDGFGLPELIAFYAGLDA
jgi:hypothetical protein